MTQAPEFGGRIYGDITDLGATPLTADRTQRAAAD
ncbi:MAG: hypothetical protein QOE49_4428 [Rhodospirillaceae bacterium]|jgi:hypothetical protein|nr:hypothetical protein [Rhodospirillaceae bacterium]MEA2807128.1 hypothetical protein [Rhodospirillaceae bacterium]